MFLSLFIHLFTNEDLGSFQGLEIMSDLFMIIQLG